ncbi:hypothetical protein Q7C36_012227 [Tachysurus vachellii]|uniref:Uncharacterized protein n=1 Tax=Tachysurus vachellii TaxID=175792 RepID=A0AA88SRK7_TACVA|nr:hypothetical protein Q7C36_012227 [Tachysurus vachellii]
MQGNEAPRRKDDIFILIASHTCSIATYRFQQAAEHLRTRADKNNVQLRKAQAADKIDTSHRRTAPLRLMVTLNVKIEEAHMGLEGD